MSGGEIAALIAAGAFAMLVIVLAVPILRLRHTIDEATRALRDVADRTGPMLHSVQGTLDNTNVALGQVHTTLDEVNLELTRVSTITENVVHLSSNVANLSTVVTTAVSNPIVKVAAFGYGVRKAAADRRKAHDETEVRRELKERRKASRRG